MIEEKPPTPDELVKLCAVNNDFFARTFFPNAVRQSTPKFHREIDDVLDNPTARYVNLLCYRDAAKTTKLRIFTAKRIAYGFSRTILYVGASESHAVRSIQWIRGRVESKIGATGAAAPSYFSQVFGLRQGKKWTDTELEIFHGTDEHPIWLLGVGITGNIRGINFDDYRPDLIVLDDILTDENGASKEQRDTIANLVGGALKGSLAPKSESPNSKLVMLNTPQNLEDVAHVVEKDPEWITKRFSCWTPETQNLPVNEQISSWEERYSTEERRKEKLNAIATNKLSIFAKEKEVRIVSSEKANFRVEWLQYTEALPKFGHTVLSIDPVPPPSAAAIKKGQTEVNDFEVHHVWRKSEGNYYLMESDRQRGHTPSWTLASVFRLAFKYRVEKIIVEGVAYQKVLKWILEQEMKRRGIWYTVQTFDDIRSKPVRINAILHGPATNGKLWCRSSESEFISQFTTYPSVTNDDELDAAAMGVYGLTNVYDEEGSGKEQELDNSHVPKLRIVRGCP